MWELYSASSESPTRFKAAPVLKPAMARSGFGNQRFKSQIVTEQRPGVKITDSFGSQLLELNLPREIHDVFTFVTHTA